MPRVSRLRTINRREFLGATGALAVSGTVALNRSGSAQGATPAASPVSSPVPGQTGDWATFGYDYGQTRHVPFTDITKENVADLGIVWSFDFLEDDDSIPPANQCYPIVMDGTVYVTTTYNNIYALDARTGEKSGSGRPKTSASSRTLVSLPTAALQ